MTNSNPFDSDDWLERLRQLPANELGPGKVQPGALESIENVRANVAKWSPAATPKQQEFASAAVAVWAVRQDCLDVAHEISQEMKLDLGSYIHGIVHRREPDYSNARYWFRQVGRLPFYDELHRAASEELAEHRREPAVEAVIGGETWNPVRFVDLCESAIRGSQALHFACRKVQQRELELLFEHCMANIGS
jgi:hypothetical protein